MYTRYYSAVLCICAVYKTKDTFKVNVFVKYKQWTTFNFQLACDSSLLVFYLIVSRHETSIWFIWLISLTWLVCKELVRKKNDNNEKSNIYSFVKILCHKIQITNNSFRLFLYTFYSGLHTTRIHKWDKLHNT